MDVREKLIEIVCDAMESDGCIGHCNHSPCFGVERVVNALIDNGVTVQEWISVNDRLPEGMDRVLVLFENGGIMDAQYEGCIDDESRFGTYREYYDPDTLGFVDGEWIPYECVTHWMPLPQPPKGE